MARPGSILKVPARLRWSRGRDQARWRKRRGRHRRGRLQDYFLACLAGWYRLNA